MTGAGIEPAARALKVRCSTTELPGPGSKHGILSEWVVALKRALDLGELRAAEHIFQRVHKHRKRIGLLNQACAGTEALQLR